MKSRVRRTIHEHLPYLKGYEVQIRIMFIWVCIAYFAELDRAIEFKQRIRI